MAKMVQSSRKKKCWMSNMDLLCNCARCKVVKAVFTSVSYKRTPNFLSFAERNLSRNGENSPAVNLQKARKTVLKPAMKLTTVD